MNDRNILDLSSLPDTAVLATRDAAPALNRKSQTLRRWACDDSGPIRPLRVNGRLAWRVSDIRRLLGLTEAA